MNLKSEISFILSEDLPIVPEDIKTHLSACLKLTKPVMTARCNAQFKLATERDRLRHPKDLKQFTDMDRTIMLDSATAHLSKEYNALKGLEDLLQQRITVLLAFL